MQTHAIIGNRAVDLHSEQFIPMVLLNNLLGGPGMNSRLNLNIREKYGFAYNLESFYSPYTDTGVFGVYLGTHKDDIDKSLNLVKKEHPPIKIKSPNLGRSENSDDEKEIDFEP